MKKIMTNETGPIKEKHTILERLFNQKYILESQGLLTNNTYDLTQYSIPPTYDENNWKKVQEAFYKMGSSINDVANAFSEFAKKYQERR